LRAQGISLRRPETVSATYRCRPPFGVVTWPFQWDRWTQDLPLAEIDVVH
jgi:hypothetical protein